MFAQLNFPGTNGSWILSVEIFTEVPVGATVTGKIEIRLDSTTISTTVPITLTQSALSFSTLIDVPKVMESMTTIYFLELC